MCGHHHISVNDFYNYKNKKPVKAKKRIVNIFKYYSVIVDIDKNIIKKKSIDLNIKEISFNKLNISNIFTKYIENNSIDNWLYK
jgi:hypothetical protein